VKTLSSDKSLLLWRQNMNGSNISNVSEDFLREDYREAFKKLDGYAEAAGLKVKFIDAWQKICNHEACGDVRAKLQTKSSDAESIENVVNKFRGNLGEILAEKVFELFGTQWDVKPGSYDTVDPQNEKFIDAQAAHIADGLPVGVQVKNYTVHSKTHRNPVKWETFIKSMAMNSYWCTDVKIVKPEDFARFFQVPRQYIFSFTPAAFNLLTEEYAGSVRFIGPDEIGKLGLENKPYVFKQILDEIA